MDVVVVESELCRSLQSLSVMNRKDVNVDTEAYHAYR